MENVAPKVFLVGETRVNRDGLAAYLTHIGVPEWESDASSDPELLTEVMGRLCYRSFKPGLNPNVTKIRERNSDYIQNIIRVKHGSVIEHATVNFIFANVSRVFTHELVRHRPGVAISQESLRFVRLDALDQWIPAVIRESPEALEVFARTFAELERIQLDLAGLFELDKMKECDKCDGTGQRGGTECAKCKGTGEVGALAFSTKKVITSAMRRLAPIGVATNIGWSANIRTIRWLLEARTHPSAEEEIRLVFSQVGTLMLERYPNLFADFKTEEVDGHLHFVTESSKV